MANKPQKPKRKPTPPLTPQLKERPTLPTTLMGVADAPDTGQPDDAHPSWRLTLLDLEHTEGWSWEIGKADLQRIISFLTEMERLTWGQIKAQMYHSKRGSHRKHHAMPSEVLCREAQQRLRILQLEGFELFRFRLGGALRLWGLIEQGVFYPLWWDPEHKVYPADN
jgi:hypothetical protein